MNGSEYNNLLRYLTKTEYNEPNIYTDLSEKCMRTKYYNKK
jgi:hypothetical protein